MFVFWGSEITFLIFGHGDSFIEREGVEQLRAREESNRMNEVKNPLKKKREDGRLCRGWFLRRLRKWPQAQNSAEYVLESCLLSKASIHTYY